MNNFLMKLSAWIWNAEFYLLNINRTLLETIDVD